MLQCSVLNYNACNALHISENALLGSSFPLHSMRLNAERE